MANPKLTQDQNAEIIRRKREEQPTPTNAVLAADYGVSDSAISRLLGKAKDPVLATPSLSTAPHNRIFASPLNPRKRFDPVKQAELTESVRKEGILLPLLVRKANQPGNAPISGATPDDMEIIAGERRWRSGAALVAEGVWPADSPIHTKLVDPCSDLKLLQLAYTENVARQDMTALEEAEAISAMQTLGASPAEAAETMGMNKRTAQKRLRLIKDTTPQVREALEDGRISTESANVLAAYCPKSQQNATLEEIAQGRFRTTEGLKSAILSTRIPASAALFDLDAYQGGWVEDEDKPGERYFADQAQFRSLQEKAIERKTAELQGKYAWVTVFDEGKGESFRNWNYTEKAGHPMAGAAVIVNRRMMVSFKLDMVEDTVLQAERQPIGPARQATPPEPVTKPHCSHAHKRKTEALQIAIAEKPMMAMRLAIMGLLGAYDAVRIKAEAHPAGDDRCIAPAVAKILASFIPALQEASKDELIVSEEQGWLRTKTDPGYYSVYTAATWDKAKLWQSLVDLPDSEINRLFATLAALRCGSFDGYAPSLGDHSVAIAVAGTLGLIGEEAKAGLTLQPQDLEGLRKDTLLSIARSVGTRDAHKLKTADLKAQICDDADPYYVLPTLRFGSEENVKLMLQGKAHPAELAEAFAKRRPVERLDGPPFLHDWNPEAKLAEIVADIDLDEVDSEHAVRWTLIAGINAMQRHTLDRPIADTARFAPEEINVGAQFLIDELFQICGQDQDYAGISTLGDAIAFVCKALGTPQAATQAAE